MLIAERSIDSRLSSLDSIPHSTRGGGENGFLLFDRQAKHHQAWITFKQSPENLALENQIRQMDIQSLDISQQAQLRDQQLLEQVLALRTSLEQTRLAARQTKEAFESGSIRAKVYRITKRVAPSLAERIIPYDTAQAEFKFISEQKKAVEAERKSTKSQVEQEQAKLGIQKRSKASRLEKLGQVWLFSTSERTLYYALTNLAQDAQRRNRFLLQYSQSVGLNIGEVQRQYIELAAKAAPSLYPGIVLNGHNSSAQVEVRLDPEHVDSHSGQEHQSTFDYRKSQKETSLECTGSTEDNPSKKKVILMITDTPLALAELSEVQLNELISESGTPIAPDQIKIIIERLSETSDPLGEYKRYPQTVQTGEFKGFHIIKRGKKGRLIFKYRNGEVYIRFGDYYEVYEDGKRWQG